jgi:hypothetical protein
MVHVVEKSRLGLCRSSGLVPQPWEAGGVIAERRNEGGWRLDQRAEARLFQLGRATGATVAPANCRAGLASDRLLPGTDRPAP